MSSEVNKTSHEVSPVPPPPPPPPKQLPPKRFLDHPSHSLPPSRSIFYSPLSSTRLLASPTRGKLTASRPQPQTKQTSSPSPPRLIRFPAIVLTPVDSTTPVVGGGGGKEKACTEEKPPLQATTSTGRKVTLLPPPPPLIKMPITTRNEKRSVVKAKLATSASNEGPVLTESTSKALTQPPNNEPTTKRVRRENSESSNASASSTTPTPTTPRKIIQEIFGPDKSKRSKGKGRKRKRAGPTKKKAFTSQEVLPDERPEEGDDDQEDLEADADQTVDDHDKEVAEINRSGGPAIEIDHEDEAVEEEDSQSLHEESEAVVNENNSGMTEDQDDTVIKVELPDAEDEIEIDTQSQDIKLEGEDEEVEDAIKQDFDEVEDEKEEEEVATREKLWEYAGSGSSRCRSRRKAKQVANEKLRRISNQPLEDVGNKGDENIPFEKSENGTNKPADVRSRRSTTEESSGGSSGSIDPADSEGSVNGSKEYSKHRNLIPDRQLNNMTPLSIISEDDDNDLKQDGENISVGDLNDQKDSDADSTYSWKPVRAAAAAALEQVTKQQGTSNGSITGSTVGVDPEAKASAAAERRARKIMRYKGRNRRTLLFKSSNSKKFTAVRNNKYSAQPTVARKIFYDGHYFQAGDVVAVEMEDEFQLHGQVRGLLMDHLGQVSLGIRWLSPKHTIYGMIDFDPANYAFRYDIPERLVKIQFVNFIMHLNIDFFEGHYCYSKVEKSSIYTRMGKTLHTCVSDEEESTVVNDNSRCPSDFEDDTVHEGEGNSADITDTKPPVTEDNGNQSDTSDSNEKCQTNSPEFLCSTETTEDDHKMSSVTGPI